MAALRPTSGNANSKSSPLPSSPNTASLSPSPMSGLTSPGSPSTNATSAAPPSLPSDEEVEAVIKQATSNRAMPDGRPPPSKDTRTQLFAGNLPYRVRWQDLKDLFRRAGTVLRADVSLTPDNRSRGYGTVLLASAEDAGRAVDMFNGYIWQGRILEVRLDRLGNVPGADIDANVGALVQGVGIATVGALNALAPNMSQLQLNGLHVPSPIPFVTHQPSGNGQALGNTNKSNSSPVILPATSSLTNGAQTATNANASFNSLKPNLIALQQQELEREDLLVNQGAPQIGGLGGLDPFLGGYTYNRGSSADLDREQARSSLGMRSLFVGNWQDLKDLFRQAGTILRADVSLAPDGRSRGFGTVTLANEIDAERAVAMFNGFDYNGRILKVHYDKFCASSPILSTLSPNPSNLATPVQTNSAQAALVQAAQLQQLVSGQTYDHLDAFNNWNGNHNGGGTSNDSNTNGFASFSRSRGFGNDFQAALEPFPLQSQSRPTTSSGSSNEQVRQRVISTTSEASVSPFSVHLPGPSPSLAERRQKIPPPIGPVSSPSSRRPSAADASSVPNTNLLNANATASSGAMTGTSSGASPASSTSERRSTGQSFPASSTSAPPRTTVESYNSEGKRAATASGSTSNAIRAQPSRSDQRSHSTSTNPTSPRSSHPAHPGPISLPPPLPASSFPVYSPHHHPMSPPGQHPMSPPMYAGYPSYGPMSPMHAYAVPHYMHPANVTPHGLPPITPSMPSFSFAAPSQPSPSVPVGGSSAIPPTPADGTAPAPEGYLPSGQPGDSSVRGMGVVPMMSPPLPLPHHVFQPFTPGTVVSPGAFYGRPIGVPPRGAYLNHTAGSPIIGYPTYAYPHPGSQPGSPYYLYNVNGGQHGEEPSGYFPPVGPPPPQHPQQPPRHEGYFPPVSVLGSSGLASEILRDGSTINVEGPGHGHGKRLPHERNDSGSGPTSSENGPEEDADAERARSTSSGATSWRSSDVRGPTNTSANASKNLETLVQDIASVRLGSPPPNKEGRPAKRGEVSYAAAAAAAAAACANASLGVQRTESAGGYAGNAAGRHNSTGSEGARRPSVMQKSNSDETTGRARLA